MQKFKRLYSLLSATLAATAINATLSPSARAEWTSVSVGGGGFVTSLASSSDGKGMYIRTDVGGAFRWIESTNSWKNITDSLPDSANGLGETHGICSLAVAPDNANKVYIAAGKFNYSTPSGIYVTNDSSVANPVWITIDSTIRCVAVAFTRPMGERLAVDPNNPNVVYYGTNNITGGGTGLKKYVYQGGAWVASSFYVQPGAIGDANAGITFVACDKTGGTVNDGVRTVSKYIYLGVYSATAGSGGIYASSNGGLAWKKVAGPAVDKPARGEVASDGTLYVTHGSGVAKLTRASTTAVSFTPPDGAGYAYNALAIDPSNPQSVMVASNISTNKIFRFEGGTWKKIVRNVQPGEPDGTPSFTTNGGMLNISDLAISPTNSNEVWSGDFLSVQRTQNINTATSDWHCLQKNQEEVVVRALKSTAAGSPLFSALSDVDGFSHLDTDSRSLLQYEPRLQKNRGSTTSIDFCETTYGPDTVLVRVFDSFYTASDEASAGTGAVSLDNGTTWLRFGQVASKMIYNNLTTPGWEEWDLTPYIARQKALGNNLVSLAVACDDAIDGYTGDSIRFSSKEGANPPQLVINGNATLPAVADAFVYQYTPTVVNNGSALQVSFQQGGSFQNRRAFLKFDLTNAPSITMAKLRLYRNISAIYNRNFPTGIYGVDPANAWSEASLTWSNQPSTLAGSDPQLNPRVTGDLHGGRVAISAIDPNNLVWVDANSTVGAVGRVYYSKDRGVSWVRATYGGSDLSIARIDPNEVQKHPLASDRVSGAFYLYSGLDNGAILRNIDGGATWSKLAATGDSSPNRPQCKILGVPGVADRFWIMTQYWNSPIRFQSWNGTSLVSRTEISNVVDFSFGKAAPGNLNPTVYVRKKDGTYWSSTNATAGGATWTQLSVSTINSGAIQLEADRQNYGRLYVGTGGRGIMYAGGTAEKTFFARDSFVKDGSDADINQAGTTSTTIDVETDASPGNREGFLQFDFSGYAGTVSSATIILTPTASGTSGITNDVYFVPNSSWSEQTITWNSKPASSGAPLGSYTIAAGSPITVPVTSQVQAAMGTGQKLSIRIACSAAANSLNMVTYASSENPNVNLQPVLRIVP